MHAMGMHDKHNPVAAPRVGVVMGSRSDWETMQHVSARLDALGIAHEVRIVSAHRTPDLLFDYAEQATALLPAVGDLDRKARR